MRLDGALNDGQPEPAAAGPAGDERLEQPLADFLRNAGAVVPHLKPHRVLQVGPVGNLGGLTAATDYGDPDGTPGGLHRIEHQVGDDAMEQVFVALEQRVAALRP